MTDPVARKFQVARLVGPKMIKEWFYNVIKPFWLPYWLNEGFATFFGIYAANKVVFNYFQCYFTYSKTIQYLSIHIIYCKLFINQLFFTKYINFYKTLSYKHLLYKKNPIFFEKYLF